MRTFLVSGLLWLLSLAAGASAIVAAEFGAAAWVFVVLLGWLLTAGLPTLSAVLLLIGFWDGQSLPLFVTLATPLAFVFQFIAVWVVRQGIRKLRSEQAT